MKKEQSRVHDFVFRGLLSEEAVDRAGRSTRVSFDGPGEAEIERILSITSLPDDLVQQAKTMSAVYVAVAAFENSVRELILGVLLEAIGEDWWTSAISQKVSDRAEKRKADEDKIKWHTNRGMHPLYYTTMADLVNAIRNNWEHLERYVQSVDWVASIFDAVERSRNVIMHNGTLAQGDIERLGIFIRDWIKQVGA